MKSSFNYALACIRGIAILFVLLYHTSSTYFPHGIVGVDIFFVLSGYLIAFSSYSFDTSTFIPFRSFLRKRFLRIYSLLVPLPAIICIFSLFLSPQSVATFFTYLYSLFGLSDLYLFVSGSDYFSPSILDNFLYPLWTVGIEIQFYFIFSLGIFLSTKDFVANVFKRQLSFVFAFLLLVFIGSFALFYLTHNFSFRLFVNFTPSRSYLFSFSRYWELALGSILYFSLRSLPHSSRFIRKTSGLYLQGLLLFCLFIFPLFTSVSFDYVLTFTFLILSLLFYLSLSLEFRVSFFFPLLLFLSKISFSLYIIHWPVFYIASRFFGQTIFSIVIGWTISIALSFLTFYIFEVNFRIYISNNFNIRSFFTLLAFPSVTAVFYLLPFNISLYDFWLLDRGSTRNNLISDSNCRYNPASPDPGFKSDCLITISESLPSVYFFGDSHNDHLSGLFQNLVDHGAHNVYSYTFQASISPPINFSGVNIDFDRSYRKSISTASSHLLSVVDRLKPNDYLVISSWFDYYLNFTRPSNSEPYPIPPPSSLVNASLIRNSSYIDLIRSSWVSEINKVASLVADKRAHLIILAPIPEMSLLYDVYSPSDCIKYPFKRIPDYCSFSQGLSDFSDTTLSDFASLRQGFDSTVHVFYPHLSLCSSITCSLYDSNNHLPLYYDSSHLTNYGSSSLFTSFKRLLDSIE